MSDTNVLDTLNTNATDLRYQRFEAAWLAWHPDQTPPCWRDYLPPVAAPCSDDLLLLLIQVDIECRIKAGLPALLSERYFEHPRWRQATRLDARHEMEVIQWEYQQRWQKGEQAHRAEYESAFPQHAEELRQLRPRSRCPRCHRVMVLEETYQTLLCSACSCESVLITPDPPFMPESRADAAPPPELDLRGYELIEELGKGGMGEVYRCGDPALGRDLAIKVMKTNFRHHAEVERRFLREARITGSLQHPGIVPIHNLGRLADGRLHYTMRLVRGRTLADILKDEAGREERLASLLSVFEKMCQAMAYAHSKRVIHRDLKPANVMVDRFGEVQVMDWGLARLLTAEDSSEPRQAPAENGDTVIRTEAEDTPLGLTRTGARMGTLAYMPPEQVLGEWDAVDERADVFALGAILCEMLTGAAPYQGKDAEELLRRARRGDVADALSRLARCGADAALTTLCQECLACEREGRPRDASIVARRVADYQTEMQERLRRAEVERAEAQVKAREERRRRRWALSFLVVLLAGAVFSTWQAIRATFAEARARDNETRALQMAEANEKLAIDKANLAEGEKSARKAAVQSQQAAKEETRKARTVAIYLAGMFEAADPLGLSSNSIILPRATGENLSAQDLLDRGTRKCERELKSQPELQAAVLRSIGDAYVNLGEYKKARPVLEKALRLREQCQADPLEIAACQHSLAALSHAQGDYETAEKRYRQALHLREAVQPAEELPLADTLFYLGWLLVEKGEHAEAESCFQRSLDLRRKHGEESRVVALSLIGLAAVYLDQNTKYTQAWMLTQQAMAIFQRLEGDQKLTRALGDFQEGMILLLGVGEVPLLRGVAQSRGEKKLIECLRLIKESPLGSRHIFVAFVAGTLAGVLARRGDDNAAEAYFQECLQVIEERTGLAHPKLDLVVLRYGELLKRQGKNSEANRLGQRFLAARTKRFGDNHLYVANALVVSAAIQGDFAPETERMLLRAHAIYQRLLPLKGRDTRMFYTFCLLKLGVIALDVRRHPAEAEKRLCSAWDALQHSDSVATEDLAVIQTCLGRALLAQSRPAEAETAFRKALALWPDDLAACINLGAALEAQGKTADAERAYRRTTALRPDLARGHNDLGNVLYAQGRFTEALAAFRRAHELGSKESLHQARVAAHLSELEDKLPAILQGKAAPASAAESLELASMCQQYRQLHVAAARLYREAFVAEKRLAADLNAQHRYRAARSAALAAAGKNADAGRLPDRAASEYRGWALGWLRADLAAYAKLADRNDPWTNDWIQQRLMHWRGDAALAALRDPAALDGLPSKEREDWRAVWREVQELAKRVAPGEKALAKP